MERETQSGRATITGGLQTAGGGSGTGGGSGGRPSPAHRDMALCWMWIGFRAMQAGNCKRG